MGVFIPLWQRGIKGDFKIMVGKSPLPLFAKEGYKGTFVLLEPITEGLSPILKETCNQFNLYYKVMCQYIRTGG